jgi:hypothetical protein
MAHAKEVAVKEQVGITAGELWRLLDREDKVEILQEKRSIILRLK